MGRTVGYVRRAVGARGKSHRLRIRSRFRGICSARGWRSFLAYSSVGPLWPRGSPRSGYCDRRGDLRRGSGDAASSARRHDDAPAYAPRAVRGVGCKGDRAPENADPGLGRRARRPRAGCSPSTEPATITTGAGDRCSLMTAPPRRDDRLHVESQIDCDHADCPLGAAMVAPLVVAGELVGSFVALYARGRRVTPDDTRTVAEAASLVSAQLELKASRRSRPSVWPAPSCVRCARRSRRTSSTTRSRRSPAHIHSNPEEARELLTEFAEFTRYAFRGRASVRDARGRAAATWRSTCGWSARASATASRCACRSRPRCSRRCVPVLSLQPLVENAIRHGVERRGHGRIEIVGHDLDADVELQRPDNGVGMDPERAAEVARRSWRRHRHRERPGAPSVELRPRLRARDRDRARPRDHRDDDAAEVPRRGAGRVSRRGRCGSSRWTTSAPRSTISRGCCEGSPAVDEVVLADGGGEALRKLAERQFDARVPRRAHAGPRRAGARRRARPLRQPAGARVRLRLRGRRGRRLRADLRPLDYLMKPVCRSRVEEALQRVAGGPRGTPATAVATAADRGRDTNLPEERTDEIIPVEHQRGGATRLVAALDDPVRQGRGRLRPDRRRQRPLSWSGRRCRTSSSAGGSTGSCGSIAATLRTCAARSRSAPSSAAARPSCSPTAARFRSRDARSPICDGGCGCEQRPAWLSRPRVSAPREAGRARPRATSSPRRPRTGRCTCSGCAARS